MHRFLLFKAFILFGFSILCFAGPEQDVLPGQSPQDLDFLLDDIELSAPAGGYAPLGHDEFLRQLALLDDDEEQPDLSCYLQVNKRKRTGEPKESKRNKKRREARDAQARFRARNKLELELIKIEINDLIEANKILKKRIRQLQAKLGDQ